MTAERSCEELMNAALAGDNHAYQRLLHQSAALLRPYVLKNLQSHADTDDIIQEILISVHRARHTYDSDRPYAPWLFAIAQFRIKDHWRRLYRDKLRHASDITEMADFLPDTVTESHDSNEYATETLNQLPRKQAMILEFIHIHGLTMEETGKRIGMTGNAVKVAAHRAYKTLRTKLGDAA